jgi:LacI family transcriptional regulator
MPSPEKGSATVITIKDIALQAGVSIGTVDRVLHGRGRVSKKSEDKINAIVKKTGYKTNIYARNLSLQTTYHFGIIIPQAQQKGRYWEIIQKGVNQAVTELRSFNIHADFFFFNKFSETSFLEAGKKALEQGVNGLLIAPVLFDACAAFTTSIPQHIPYVFIDSTIPNTAPLATIGQNSFQSGVCGAKLMYMLMRSAGSIAVVQMLPIDFHINERVRGFTSFFKNIPSATVHVFKGNGDMPKKEFIDFVASIESKLVNCKGFFVTNADAHLIAKALRSMKSTGKHIIGYDCISENIQLLEEGYIDFIISQNPQEQGHAGINTLFRHLVMKEPCIMNVQMPIDIVMAENVTFYK